MDARMYGAKEYMQWPQQAWGTARSDTSIRDDVQFELKWGAKVTSNDIGLTAKEGVVALSGYVSGYWEDAAEKAARRVYDVRGVANDLQVRLSYTRTGSKIARDAVHVLESHTGIPSEGIKATVKDGWVTLEGTVEWQCQKALAESSVKKLRGILRVSDNIKIKPQVSSTEVKERIEDALRPSAEVDTSRITVEVDGDAVTLRGSVRSWEDNTARTAA